MIGDLAAEIAGDDAIVEVMFGANVDPHLFRPTRDDVARLLDADLVLYNGFALEGHLDETLRRVASGGVQVLAIAEAILSDDEVLRHDGTPDPHVWMDPSLWQRGCGVIAEALIIQVEARGQMEARGASGNSIAARGQTLARRLTALDASIEEQLAAIPPSQRVLVTAHDAFGYFGRRFDIDVEAIQGVSTSSEAGLRAVEELVDRLVEARIPAVFFESTVSERNVRALIEGAKARGHDVKVGGVLHSDAPGAAGTYEAMLEHNVSTVVAALSGGPQEASRSVDRVEASHSRDPTNEGAETFRASTDARTDASTDARRTTKSTDGVR